MVRVSLRTMTLTTMVTVSVSRPTTQSSDTVSFQWMWCEVCASRQLTINRTMVMTVQLRWNILLKGDATMLQLVTVSGSVCESLMIKLMTRSPVARLSKYSSMATVSTKTL